MRDLLEVTDSGARLQRERLQDEFTKVGMIGHILVWTVVLYIKHWIAGSKQFPTGSKGGCRARKRGENSPLSFLWYCAGEKMPCFCACFTTF